MCFPPELPALSKGTTILPAHPTRSPLTVSRYPSIATFHQFLTLPPCLMISP